MQIRTKLVLCVSTLAAVIFACSVLLLWNTFLSTYNHQRTNLAYSELTGYLRLSGEVFRTFKQVRRDLLGGDGVLTFDLDKAEKEISKIISDIEKVAISENEIGLRAKGEIDDTLRLIVLNTEVSAAFADIRQTVRLLENGPPDEARKFLDNSLEARIDRKIAQIVEEAVLDEREEVAEALEEIEQINKVASLAAGFAILTGIILTVWVVYTLALRLRISLRNLEMGAERFASGQLDHKIPVFGRDEFANLSHRFNTMASQLRDQRDALEDARNQLENRVAERTNELQIANAELKRRDETRRQFFADIGHELRTPITAIRGEAEVALRAREDHRNAYQSALDRIVGVTDQLTRFVNDIFLIAREQAGVSDMRRSRLELKEPILEAARQMRGTIEQSEGELVMSLGDDTALVYGDRQRLCQLVQILISNAIQHSTPKTKIRIGLVRQADGWELSVEDNGPGISEKDVSGVFERFYRGNKSGEYQSDGAGLGLPIARSIANAHGGRIWIDMSYKKGTAVRVLLPLVDENSIGLHEPTDVYEEAPA